MADLQSFDDTTLTNVTLEDGKIYLDTASRGIYLAYQGENNNVKKYCFNIGKWDQSGILCAGTDGYLGVNNSFFCSDADENTILSTKNRNIFFVQLDSNGQKRYGMQVYKNDSDYNVLPAYKESDSADWNFSNEQVGLGQYGTQWKHLYVKDAFISGDAKLNDTLAVMGKAVLSNDLTVIGETNLNSITAKKIILGQTLEGNSDFDKKIIGDVSLLNENNSGIINLHSDLSDSGLRIKSKNFSSTFGLIWDNDLNNSFEQFGLIEETGSTSKKILYTNSLEPSSWTLDVDNVKSNTVNFQSLQSDQNFNQIVIGDAQTYPYFSFTPTRLKASLQGKDANEHITLSLLGYNTDVSDMNIWQGPSFEISTLSSNANSFWRIQRSGGIFFNNNINSRQKLNGDETEYLVSLSATSTDGAAVTHGFASTISVSLEQKDSKGKIVLDNYGNPVFDSHGASELTADVDCEYGNIVGSFFHIGQQVAPFSASVVSDFPKYDLIFNKGSVLPFGGEDYENYKYNRDLSTNISPISLGSEQTMFNTVYSQTVQANYFGQSKTVNNNKFFNIQVASDASEIALCSLSDTSRAGVKIEGARLLPYGNPTYIGNYVSSNNDQRFDSIFVKKINPNSNIDTIIGATSKTYTGSTIEINKDIFKIGQFADTPGNIYYRIEGGRRISSSSDWGYLKLCSMYHLNKAYNTYGLYFYGDSSIGTGVFPCWNEERDSGRHVLLGNGTYQFKGIYGYEVFANGSSLSSDKRLKTAFSELSQNSLDVFFDSLCPLDFEFKNNLKNKSFGFIAQDVENSLEKVFGHSNFSLLKKPDENREYYYLGYTEFIALNTDQIQKLKKRVSSQEEKIQNLENEIIELKAMIDYLANTNRSL